MKIFIFTADGVGLKNFAFTRFYEIGKKEGHEIVYWNNTVFSLNEEFGYAEYPVSKVNFNPLSNLYKRAKIRIELNLNYKKTKDKAYLSYLFPQSYKGVKNFLKSLFVDYLVLRYSSAKGLQKVLSRIYEIEKKSTLYKDSLKQLKQEQPDFVFCTSQRSLMAVAPLLAAAKLGIPTATFIFSWDNLPKATLLVKTDYYFVWSSFMRKELLQYAPQIKKEQIIVTGTPQFEPHFNMDIQLSRAVFFEKYHLDVDKKYICFTGDDTTTSPNDEFYLEDTAKAVRELNKLGNKVAIIFRRCPVDFSGRYNAIINEYKDVIVAIDPLWEKKGSGWNTILPTQKDLTLLTNICLHSEMVFNVASSTVFDFVIHNHPCAYFNYKTEKVNNSNWSTKKIYNFIHFRSMPSKEKTVIWINSKDDIKDYILNVLHGDFTVDYTKEWFNIITTKPQKSASKNIWKEINTIVTCI